MTTTQHQTELVAAEFDRPGDGPAWKPESLQGDFPLTGKAAWQSNGGPTRGHSARSLPFSFEARFPDRGGHLLRIHILGVFALFAAPDVETFGTMGATVQLLSADGGILGRFDLVNGRHYTDAANLNAVCKVVGDGTSLDGVGECTIHDQVYRVDNLTMDVPIGARPKRLRFKDLGSPASFVIFDVFFEYEDPEPVFHRPRLATLNLSELGTAIRVGDRVKFSRTLEQLDAAIDDAEDLDEARGQALTVLAVVLAALIETGGGRSVYRVQLDAARDLDAAQSRAQIKDSIRSRITQASKGLFSASESPSDRLVDRALGIVERHYAKDLTDAMVASQLGLSTSHFRFLFRQATGHPFHKYVVALRLEKAKQMLIDQEMPISQVAAAVGFAGLSHFSRAFTQRFSASPSHFRRTGG